MCSYKRQFKTRRLTRFSENEKTKENLIRYLKTDRSINKS